MQVTRFPCDSGPVAWNCMLLCVNGHLESFGYYPRALMHVFTYTSSLLNDQLADAEPKNLPPEPLASLSGKTILRWGEYRAGVEL